MCAHMERVPENRSLSSHRPTDRPTRPTRPPLRWLIYRDAFPFAIALDAPLGVIEAASQQLAAKRGAELYGPPVVAMRAPTKPKRATSPDPVTRRAPRPRP
jgi:hypothetical protein